MRGPPDMSAPHRNSSIYSLFCGEGGVGDARCPFFAAAKARLVGVLRMR
jgi:hypothetical protein